MIHSSTSLTQQRYTDAEALAVLIEACVNHTDEADVHVRDRHNELLSGQHKCITVKARKEGIIEVYEVKGYYSAPVFLMKIDLDEALFNAEEVRVQMELRKFSLEIWYSDKTSYMIEVDEGTYTGGGF